MPSRAEKKRLQKLNAERKAAGEPPIQRAKPRARLVSSIAISKNGDQPKAPPARRRKEIHPLDRLFFHSAPRKLSEDEFLTATTFRLLLECLESSGMDSTQALLTAGGRCVSSSAGIVQTRAAAGNTVSAIRDSLPSWEFEIVRKVCGEAWPLKDAVMQHAICHPDGVLDMFRNSLVHLKEAYAQAAIPWRFVATAADYRKDMEKQKAA